MESTFKSVIFGIVQGLTEFLPISSTAHLRIVPAFYHWADPGTVFSGVLQIGTAFAVVIYFWKDLLAIYGAFIKELISFGRLKSHSAKEAYWLLLGTLPIVIFGFLLKVPIEHGVFRDLNVVAFYLIFFGILLLIGEMIAKQTRTLGNINALDVILIGLSQSFALIPGVSRSGVTLFAGLLLGFKRQEAARFSFLLSVPAVIASSTLELYTLYTMPDLFNVDPHLINLVIGVVCAFLSGYLAIDFLLKFLVKHKTYIFIFYRVILGVIVIYLNCKGLIH